MKAAATAENMSGYASGETDGLARAIKEAAKSPAQRKVSYAVSCASEFRDLVTDLAERRRVNVGDIARSVMLTVPEDVIQATQDPGDPKADDRECVVLKSGPSAGKPWRRKPRLQVRLPAGHDVVLIRKALAVALDLDRGRLRLVLEDASRPTAEDRLQASEDQAARLKSIVSALSFEVLPRGVRSQADALYVLGFAPSADPDMQAVKARYRMMATIHHPDSEVGSHERMTQLNDAMAFLRRKSK